jgi:hypothetical protein
VIYVTLGLESGRAAAVMCWLFVFHLVPERVFQSTMVKLGVFYCASSATIGMSSKVAGCLGRQSAHQQWLENRKYWYVSNPHELSYLEVTFLNGCEPEVARHIRKTTFS